MRRTLAAALLASSACLAQVINVGTIAPEGSIWHETLQQIGQEWRRVSGGKVTLRIYPGGVQGDEPEMIQRVRIGQLHGVAISNVGLPYVDRDLHVLLVPMLIQSYEELDYVRDRIREKLEARLRAKGFVVLNWSDVGWVQFFTKRPVRTLEEVRKLKLITSAGDADSEALYKEFGFRVVPLAYTDMIMALQTGMIEAFDVPPLFALANQSFALAKNMIDLKWAPLVGATVMGAKAWERVPEQLRPELLKIAQAAAAKSRPQIRKMGGEAIDEMRKRGLSVVRLDTAAAASWRSEVEAGWPRLRGRWVPAELFDEVLRLRNEFRARQGGGGK